MGLLTRTFVRGCRSSGAPKRCKIAYSMVSQSNPYGAPGLCKRSSGTPQTKSTNKRLFIQLAVPFSQWQYKCTVQCFQCVQYSYFDPMKLISKSMNCESQRGNDLFLFFSKHPNFGPYNAFSGVIYLGFPSFFNLTLRYLNIFKYQIEYAFSL